MARCSILFRSAGLAPRISAIDVDYGYFGLTYDCWDFLVVRVFRLLRVI